MKWVLPVVVVVVFAGSGGLAVAREFKSKNGSVMQAELLSHRSGKVKIRRNDGKEFEMDPSLFCAEDETFIRKWMEVNPETVNYNFTVDFDRKKVDGEVSNFGYKRVKNQIWSYVITIANNSRDTVTGLTIKYRILYTNSADGEYGTSYSYYDENRVPTRISEGSEKFKQELGYNRKLVITTHGVKIDEVDYREGGPRYKDELKGCLVMILDPDDKVIGEWKSNEVAVREKTWDNTTPGAGKVPKSSVKVE